MGRLVALDRKEDALAVMEGPLKQYLTSDAPAIRNLINSALMMQSGLYRALGLIEQADAAQQTFLERQAGYVPENLSQEEPSALFGKAVQLAEQESYQEALDYLVAALARLEGKTDEESNSLRLGIQFTKVTVMGQLGAFTEALNLLSQITDDLQQHTSPLVLPLIDQLDFLEACLHALNRDVPAAILALGGWRDRMGSLNCQDIADDSDFDAIRAHPDFIAFLRDNGCGPPAAD
jgi:tetratricopeptide (TPR) repeat protein